MAKLKLKSKFEYDVAKWLRSVKQKVRYEEIRIKYAVMRHRYYKPDFILNNGIIIEAKGWLRPSDRTKHLLIKAQYPDLDIRFLFQNANNCIHDRKYHSHDHNNCNDHNNRSHFGSSHSGTSNPGARSCHQSSGKLFVFTKPR